MTGADVSQIDADGDLRIGFDVRVDAGEHFPVDLVEVEIVRGALGTAAPRIGADADTGWNCASTDTDTETSGLASISSADTTEPRVAIVSVAGASPTFGPFNGYGYDVGYNSGYFEFENRDSLDFSGYDSGYGAGNGYGYNGGATGVTLRVVVDIEGCNFFTSPTDFSAPFHFQAWVGAPTTLVPSLPVSKSLANPAFVADDTVDEYDAATTTTSSGTLTSTTTTLAGSGSGGNDNIDVTGLTPLASLNPDDPSLGLPGVQEVRATFDPNLDVGLGPGVLPPGTEIGFSHGSAAGGSLANPSFGIDSAALAGVTNVAPLLYFELVVHIPGMGTVPAGDVFSTVVIDLEIPKTDISSPNRMQLRGFSSDDGTLKSTQPSRSGPRNEDPNWAYTFTITDFSVFAAITSPPAGGGGGSAPADTDNNGLPNEWEEEHFEVTTGTDPEADPDSDTLTNLQEYEAGTDPNKADTDADGFSDSVEVTAGSDPLDPNSPGDFADTDDDGLPDAWELEHFTTITGADPASDAENDGLTNLQEFQAGTTPTRSDTDGDGISDGDEIRYGTDPKDADSPEPDETSSPTQDETETDGGGTSRIPGFELTFLVAALAAAFLVRRRL